ncbi:hypothetical protein [Streptomyces ortus]|uniref:HNH endonuclease n=1 Tax=Streptomyces ortus TaxID=2867268 RepID=A0ABT3UZC8_9ACTN|nr:hypothetical protein [Streptomyces ortus]MCX4232788.1 hypothetical protein [Streptomyces ortus]
MNEPHAIAFAVGNPQFRLAHFKRWIAAGWALDLNDAVRVNAQLLRNARHAQLDGAPYQWDMRTATKDRRRWEHHRRLVLLKTATCAFCTQSAVDITYALPLSKDGTDRLRNKIPVCQQHAGLWPQIRRDLPQRVREKLIGTLVVLWGHDVHRT